MLAQGESINQALKRFRQLLERHGVPWEQRRRKYFIKPAQARRAKQFRKRFRARTADLLAKKAGAQPVSSMPEATQTFWKRTGKP